MKNDIEFILNGQKLFSHNGEIANDDEFLDDQHDVVHDIVQSLSEHKAMVGGLVDLIEHLIEHPSDIVEEDTQLLTKAKQLQEGE